MEHKSVWLDSADIPHFASLEDDLEVDVAIAGGGLVGLTTALLAQRAGARVAVLEATGIGAGSTGYAEERPEGFAFSDTAFRIFILMASRRLNSDRFLTESFTEKVYTSEGLSWINDNTMITVLLRHCPQLLPYLSNQSNAFGIWNRDAGGE